MPPCAKVPHPRGRVQGSGFSGWEWAHAFEDTTPNEQQLARLKEAEASSLKSLLTSVGESGVHSLYCGIFISSPSFRAD
jgi:hypothetical protein